MSDENKGTPIDEKQATRDAEEAKRALNDPEEQLKRLTSGVLPLKFPIQSGGQEHGKIAYDFGAIMGWDYADAMDSDPKNSNLFRISPKQALSLFAVAARKATPGVSDLDVKEQLNAVDAMNAIRIASAFFVASTRVGSKLISSAP